MKRPIFATSMFLMGLSAAALVAVGQSDRPQPPVELNHVYITLQKDTIEAIASSKFIAEQFANFSRSSAKTDSGSWTGTYLTGWRAYLELFLPGDAQGNILGSAGIGFSTSGLGGGETIKRDLESLPGEKTLSEVVKKVEGQETFPWFENISLQSLSDGPFLAWLMDFRREYVERNKIELSKDGLFDRHGYNEYLSRRDNQEKAFASKLFDDLQELHLELTAAESASFGRFIKALGFVPLEKLGARAYRSGNSSIFISTPPNPLYRIRKVVCTLRKATEPRAEYKFGRDAHLTIQGGVAVWTFGHD
jgi:hypothetical protein